MPPLSNPSIMSTTVTFTTNIHQNIQTVLPRRPAADATITSASTASTTVDGISASDLIESAEDHWNVSARSILAVWGLTAVGSIIVILLFSAARPRWKLIYLPRLKIRKPSRTPKEKDDEKKMLAQMKPKERREFMEGKERDKPNYYPEGENEPGKWIARAPKAEKGYLGWLKPTWREIKVEFHSALPKRLRSIGSVVSEKDHKSSSPKGPKVSLFEQDLKLLHLLGLDAVVYLLYLRLLKYLFTTISIFASLLAIANYYLNTQTSFGDTSTVSPTESSDDLDRRATTTSTTASASSSSTANSTSVINNPELLTAANITGNALMVHIGFELIVTVLVVFSVVIASSHHLKLVQEWTHMNYNEVSFKTLMVSNLAIKKSKAKSIVTVADAKREIKSLVLGADRAKVDASVWFAVHNMNPLNEKIEIFRKKYLTRAIKAVAMEAFYGSGKGVFYDSCWKAMCGKSTSAASRIAKALQEKEEIEHLQDQIRQGQIDVRYTDLKGTVTSAFVTVPTAKKAREILKNVKDKMKEAGYQIQRAPRSHNVLWKNLEKDVKSRNSHAVIGTVALVVICFINTIPLMVITVLANLDTAMEYWPALADLEESSSFWTAVFTLLAGVLPPTISALCAKILPHVMRGLSRWSGALTRGQLDKAVMRQLFIFQLVSNFVVFSLLGVIYETYLTIAEDIDKESWSTIYASLGDVPAKVTRAYISESLYWLSWYPIHSVVACLELIQLKRLVVKAPRLLLIKTPHELAEVAQPENFEFAIEYSHIMFAMVVGLMYAPLAPIVVICATIYFWTVYIIHTNQLKYIFESKETDGKAWKIIINRLLIATVLMQLLMVLTVTLKTRSAVMGVIAGLPIGIIIVFKWYLKRHYHPDGEVFSQYIDKYEDDDPDMSDWAPEYEHELLRDDWMPKIKTVKNEKLMKAAMKQFPKLAALLSTTRKEEVRSGKRHKEGRRKRKK